MIGELRLIPNTLGGTWLVGIGLIMRGLNVARYFTGIRVHAFSSVLGALALLLGVAELLGLGLPVLPILLIVIGASIVFDMIVPSATRAALSAECGPCGRTAKKGLFK